jgi:hypothetical protein
MPKDYPDHHDAELILRLYDLRREATMREARAALVRDFWPASAEELLAVAMRPDHPLNTAFRQVGSYWEMAYGFARHGVVNADFLLESNGGEGLLLYAKAEPFLAELRAATSPTTMRSAEWIATHGEAGPALMERFRGRVRAVLAQRAAGAPPASGAPAGPIVRPDATPRA